MRGVRLTGSTGERTAPWYTAKTAVSFADILTDRIGIHVSQLRRYEAGTNQPPSTSSVRSPSLSVSIDALVFDDNERGPSDELRLALEATQHLDPDEQAMVRQLLEAIQLRHQVRTTINAAS